MYRIMPNKQLLMHVQSISKLFINILLNKVLKNAVKENLSFVAFCVCFKRKLYIRHCQQTNQFAQQWNEVNRD